MNELAASPQINALDTEFDELRLFVASSWSNLAIEERLLKLRSFVPQASTRARNCFQSALTATRQSGSPVVICTKLNNLLSAIKEHHA